ncbi:uncharacterized protein GGS22DRAFT_189722 [Annulohypoxylon maeteangense]|uniref:uncharacterized protein n=1 Tax=Annulohypoxylon maeteangense TaxID=1927788 RepID=UPI002008B516|nr:uncharacterized protein GGS22DRAFT_189722 [Annulohypoxylon maeteangense]KAI0883754.1 hypothetical protein GGS22DRAFT_189722 [Annulohypoxylon maeteangense]
MQTFTLISAIAALATFAQAGTIQARDITVDLWSDWNFAGTHWVLNAPNNQCYQINGAENDHVSSFAVHDGHTCRFFKNYSCSGDHWDSSAGGKQNMPNGWNDAASSIQCW